MALSDRVQRLSPEQLAAMAFLTGGTASAIHGYMAVPDWRSALATGLIGGAVSSAGVYGGVRGARALELREKIAAFTSGYYGALRKQGATLPGVYEHYRQVEEAPDAEEHDPLDDKTPASAHGSKES